MLNLDKKKAAGVKSATKPSRSSALDPNKGGASAPAGVQGLTRCGSRSWFRVAASTSESLLRRVCSSSKRVWYCDRRWYAASCRNTTAAQIFHLLGKGSSWTLKVHEEQQDLLQDLHSFLTSYLSRVSKWLRARKVRHALQVWLMRHQKLVSHGCIDL